MKKSLDPVADWSAGAAAGLFAQRRAWRLLRQRDGYERESERANHSENVLASDTGCLAHPASQYFHTTPTCKAREFLRSGCNRKKVVIQVVVGEYSRVVIHFPPGSGQPAALVQAVEIEESVLHADAPVIDAAAEAEASLAEGAPDVAGQILHAGLARARSGRRTAVAFSGLRRSELRW